MRLSFYSFPFFSTLSEKLAPLSFFLWCASFDPVDI